jgi:uncharacterized protein
MKARRFDPRGLDVEAFANEAGKLEGEWPIVGMGRLAESAPAEAAPGESDTVRWEVRGESRPMRGAPPQIWLHVTASTRIALECQRCLQPVPATLDAERSFLFVPGENAAAELDADSEDDVLALTRALDLQALIEDELLLVMPLVPRHEHCPTPLPLGDSGETLADEDTPHPFAALAALKGSTRPN